MEDMYTDTHDSDELYKKMYVSDKWIHSVPFYV